VVFIRRKSPGSKPSGFPMRKPSREKIGCREVVIIMFPSISTVRPRALVAAVSTSPLYLLKSTEIRTKARTRRRITSRIETRPPTGYRIQRKKFAFFITCLLSKQDYRVAREGENEKS